MVHLLHRLYGVDAPDWSDWQPANKECAHEELALETRLPEASHGPRRDWGEALGHTEVH